MIDPAMARNYISTLSGAGGGQAGGIQSLLANLRGQLYGPQAAQAAGGPLSPPQATAVGYPDFSQASAGDQLLRQPGGALAERFQGPAPNPGGDPNAGQTFGQVTNKPAWQQLREQGIPGQGSAAANRAALNGGPVAQVGVPQPGSGADQMNRYGLPLRQFQPGGGQMNSFGSMEDPRVIAMSGGGLQGGPAGGGQQLGPTVAEAIQRGNGRQLSIGPAATPGGGLQGPQVMDSLPSSAATRQQTIADAVQQERRPVPYAARDAMARLTGGIDPSTFSTPPAPRQPQGPPPSPLADPGAMKPGAAGVMPSPMILEATPGGGLQAPPPAQPGAGAAAGAAGPQAAGKPAPAGAQARTGTIGTAAQAPRPSPAALGTDAFKGPNARRLEEARAGIYNNVRTALARPRPGGGAGGRR